MVLYYSNNTLRNGRWVIIACRVFLVACERAQENMVLGRVSCFTRNKPAEYIQYPQQHFSSCGIIPLVVLVGGTGMF